MSQRFHGWLVLTLLLGAMAYCIAEEITLTTYYPSPRGMYDELRTRGDVAIGKLDPPGARLEIVGGGAMTGTALRVRNVDNTALLEVQNGGNVGIGTTNPGAKLEIAGQVKITGGAPGSNKVLISDASGLASWQTLDAVPSGGVMFFALTSCPSGWSVYGPAMGRYVVGTSTSIGSTMGTALSNLENRPAGQHRHAGTAYITTDGDSPPASGGEVIYGSGALSAPHISYPGAGAPHEVGVPSPEVGGTPAPYIQLLVCQKN